MTLTNWFKKFEKLEFNFNEFLENRRKFIGRSVEGLNHELEMLLVDRDLLDEWSLLSLNQRVL